MDARGKFGERERCLRVARGDSRVEIQLNFVESGIRDLGLWNSRIQLKEFGIPLTIQNSNSIDKD